MYIKVKLKNKDEQTNMDKYIVTAYMILKNYDTISKSEQILDKVNMPLLRILNIYISIYKDLALNRRIADLEYLHC